MICSPVLCGDDVKKPEGSDKLKTIPMKTMGGRQFWGDVRFCFGTSIEKADDKQEGRTDFWRIQQNVLSKHYRLLDSADVRLVWGTLEECEQKLQSIQQERKLKPTRGKVVVCIHGILRSSKSFSTLQKQLEQEKYTVCGFNYPSTQVSIEESAEYLHKVLESLEGFEEINFVVHSMGGLIVRTYLKKYQDKRIKRMVMLGVPNKGAKMADRLQDNIFFQAVMGPSGKQLVSNQQGVIASLPTPQFEFGIIAGGRGNTKGYNPLIPGDDDGTVGVSSTRLPGAADFLRVNCFHSFLMHQKTTNEQIIRFLQQGCFREDGEKHPVYMQKQRTEQVKEID